MKQIIGRKLGMTQIFTENGELVPVTVIEAGPCVVIQVKSKEKDGYEALQVGFGDVKDSNLSKPKKGQFKNNGLESKKYLSEISPSGDEEHKVGDIITVDSFNDVEFADVAGVSIGKGFAGVMKRWNFKGGPASHGSHSHRIPGSIGSSASPSRVFKGQKMAGHMGHEKVTVQNLKVVKIDPEQNLILIKGAIPGPKGGIVKVSESIKAGRRS